MVEQRLHVMHLVCGDNQYAVVRHIVGNHFAKLSLRGDVKTVCRFVHQHDSCTRGECEAHKHLLLLTHRQFVELMEVRKFEVLQTVLKQVSGEIGIERFHQLPIHVQSDAWHVKLLCHDKYVLLDIGIAVVAVHSVHHNLTVLRTQKSADKI